MIEAQLALVAVCAFGIAGLAACLHAVLDFREPRWIIVFMIGLGLILVAGFIAFLASDGIISLLTNKTT